jgi:hypothetical protein
MWCPQVGNTRRRTEVMPHAFQVHLAVYHAHAYSVCQQSVEPLPVTGGLPVHELIVTSRQPTEQSIVVRGCG